MSGHRRQCWRTTYQRSAIAKALEDIETADKEGVSLSGQEIEEHIEYWRLGWEE